jgi:hypothetical protein
VGVDEVKLCSAALWGCTVQWHVSTLAVHSFGSGPAAGRACLGARDCKVNVGMRIYTASSTCACKLCGVSLVVEAACGGGPTT